MKYFDWSELKNTHLKLYRGISFEEIQTAIEEGRLLEDKKHPNSKRYPHQRIFVVKVDGYVYLVPYVEDDNKYFLKTIIPSRKATKEHLEKEEES